MEVRIAGNPDREDEITTDFTPAELARRATAAGTPVSPGPVARWLEELAVRLRGIAKTIAGGHSPDREKQFEQIAELTGEFRRAGDPYFSIDTKAKEHLGRMYRKGRSYRSSPAEAFDHDFPSWADAVVIPHGIYDPLRNLGHVNLGLSHDTSEFACESLWRFWRDYGRRRYPGAERMLILCDCGGSNPAGKYLFKWDLQNLVDRIDLPIRVAHYPSYCSKYNPIERRFFPHLGRACTGQLFTGIGRVVELMRRAATAEGLRTTVRVIDRMYAIGRKATEAMRDSLNISYHDVIPKWNYTLSPRSAIN